MTPLERGLLLALAYADVFDCALDEHELYAQLVAVGADRAAYAAALESLAEAGRVERALEFVTLPGRAELAHLRRERRRLAAPLWAQAQRYAAALQRCPFVRMVAVCGSLARENAGPGADVDLFVVTAPGRLWLVHVAAMALRRLLRGPELCPNHFVAEDQLLQVDRSLYLAHEVSHVVPLSGPTQHARFLAANAWTRELLPQADGAQHRRRPLETRPGRATRLIERCLRGCLGERCDRLLHATLVPYYAWRLRRAGIPRAAVERAYTRQAQRVVGGGYAPAVARRFKQRVAQHVPELVGEIERLGLFPEGAADPSPEPELYARLLAESYGTRA